MRKKSSFILIALTIIIALFSSSCKSKNESEIVATINGENIYMYQIQDDLDFVIGIKKIDESNEDQYKSIVVEVVNAYMIDLMCQRELDAWGMTYNPDYYGASKETLVEAYGSEQALLNKLASFGLDENYLDKVCKNQANKATLNEYIASQVIVKEEDILQYYIENSGSFKADEVRGMWALFFQTEEEAKTALLDIENVGFVEYFNQQDVLSTTLAHVKFDTVTQDEFPDDLGEALFSLEINTYHKSPIKCNLGYALIYVDRIEKEYTFTYEEMKDSIETVLTDEAVDLALEEYFDNLNKKYDVKFIYGSTTP